MKTKKILYLPGYHSTGNSKANTIRNMTNCEVIVGDNTDYIKSIREYGPEVDMFIGSSFGGLFSVYASGEYIKPFLAINPVFNLNKVIELNPNDGLENMYDNFSIASVSESAYGIIVMAGKDSVFGEEHQYLIELLSIGRFGLLIDRDETDHRFELVFDKFGKEIKEFILGEHLFL